MTRKMEMIRIGSISFFFFLYKIRITILFLHDGNLEANREFVELQGYEFIISTIEFVFSGYTKVYFIHILNICVVLCG